mmetsp:Transcript_28630/g.64580  ORF Transcript_28630/g.64580 Transcript_28630/m.64580 type:complete len:197 (+) Transcript_28630:39-629(+)
MVHEEKKDVKLSSVNKVDCHGRGLLWFACESGQLEVARALLHQRAAVDQPDLLGWRPLHLASYHGHLDLVQLLVAEGSDLNAQTNAGQTPRWLAHSHTLAGTSRSEHQKIAELLSAAGASLEAVARPRLKVAGGEVRLCPEDGQKYTLESLISVYAEEQRVYTREECEDYFFKEMHCLPEDHAAWQLEPLPRNAHG